MRFFYFSKHAAWLDKSLDQIQDFQLKITNLMHRDGINCRYMGLVRFYSQKKAVKTALLIEV